MSSLSTASADELESSFVSSVLPPIRLRRRYLRQAAPEWTSRRASTPSSPHKSGSPFLLESPLKYREIATRGLRRAAGSHLITGS